MGVFDLLQFTNADELARAVARDWLNDVRLRRAERASVALSGGRIAGRFFSAVAELASQERISLNAWHFFWGDERCVPPSDPESNFALANTLLLAPLHIPEQQIHRIRGEDPPEKAAADAAVELRRVAPASADGQPLLDLIFLGIGEDGHTASLFPEESDEARRDQKVYRAVVGRKPPPRRITLGYGAIAAAQTVWVLASGSGKKSAFAESISPTGRTPLAQVLQRRAHTKIYSDILDTREKDRGAT